MKTRILFALFLAQLLFSHAQCPGSPPEGITCVPDTNFETELVNQGIDADGLVNGQVATTDISDETSLVMVSRGITDLTGIEDFTSLQILNVRGNPLGTLDLSSNTDLVTLNVVFCSLTSLTLPTTNNLTTIECNDNNLTSLSLAGIPNLATLFCFDNPNLGSLNVGSNTALTTLDCANNGLIELDVSNNADLLSLDCENNGLTELDVSNNTQLLLLDVTFNNLTELDVSLTTQLGTLDCDLNALTQLNIKNGHNDVLNSLDATNNNILTCIQVDDVDEANMKGGWQKDGAAEYMTSCPGLDIENNVFSDLLIFPNPSKNTIFFDSKVSGDYSIYNIKGQLLYKGDFKSGYNNISTSSLSSGTYILKLKSENEIFTKRIIKTF